MKILYVLITLIIMRKKWTYLETALCLYAYMNAGRKVPTGANHLIAELSKLTLRTKDSIILKTANFRSLDHSVLSKGMSHVSKLDRLVWLTLERSPQRLQRIWDETLNDRYAKKKLSDGDDRVAFNPIATGVTKRAINTRIGQEALRSLTLENYNYACSFCGLDYPDILIASHIVPWSKRADIRGDPRNVICLCANHDRAFDRGILSIDNEYKILVSKGIKRYAQTDAIFGSISGNKILLPSDKRLWPDKNFLRYHRKKIFQ
jgi:putative restriction endonuclease